MSFFFSFYSPFLLFLFLSSIFFFFFFFFDIIQTSSDGNLTRSILTYIPVLDDQGKYLSCRAEQSLIPESGIEQGFKLDIHRKFKMRNEKKKEFYFLLYFIKLLMALLISIKRSTRRNFFILFHPRKTMKWRKNFLFFSFYGKKTLNLVRKNAFLSFAISFVFESLKVKFIFKKLSFKNIDWIWKRRFTFCLVILGV